MTGFNIFKRFPTFSTLLILELILLLVISYQLQVSRRVNVLEKSTLAVFGPVQELTQSMVGSVSKALENKKTRAQLEIDNKRLTEALKGLGQLRTQLEEAELENVRLRQLLNLPRTSQWDMVGAQVIGRAHRRNDYMITINKGSRDGLQPDMGVFGLEGVVGVVWEVSWGYAKIMTANNPSSAIAVMVQDSRYLESYVSGDELLFGRLDNFPNFEEIGPGDLILTSGLDGIFPKGIHMGRVIEAKPSLYRNQNVKMRFSTDFSRLEEVMVLIPRCEEDLIDAQISENMGEEGNQ